VPIFPGGRIGGMEARKRVQILDLFTSSVTGEKGKQNW